MKRVIPLAVLALVSAAFPATAAQIVINGEASSGRFGSFVTLLPNGNIVVADDEYDHPSPALTDCGAVYLFRADGQLISKLRGAAAGDQLGSGGVTVLTNGNFVVRSPSVDLGGVQNVGAVTFVDAFLGRDGVVSSSNSLVGSATNDAVGSSVVALTNGDYVVGSLAWNNGAVSDAGAATYGNGKTGVSGVVSASNSLVGSSTSDLVGNLIVALTNGGFVVSSTNWNNGAISDVGAVTFGNGPIIGTVSASNSLVGSNTADRVGSIYPLSSGNYVIVAPFWDNGAAQDVGAVVFASGTVGAKGTINSSVALIGPNFNDRVGNLGIVELKNGNYVVSSSNYNNFRGAVTLASSISGRTGFVTPANSLVGRSQSDKIGARLGASDFVHTIVPLESGDFVFFSPTFDSLVNTSPVNDAGAMTWASGSSPATGEVTEANSIVGAVENDFIVASLTALPNGKFVFAAPTWNGPGIDRGAVRLLPGNQATVGTIDAANALVGAADGDLLGSTGVKKLSNGNFVVASSLAMNERGAITFVRANTGLVGAISNQNSLIGRASDTASLDVMPLTNGNYVVVMSSVTFASGTTGLTGDIDASNSWLGEPSNPVSSQPVTVLPNGRFAVSAVFYDANFRADIGAVFVASGVAPFLGGFDSNNSIVGSSDFDYFGSSIIPQGNDKMIVVSPAYDANGTADAGAVSLLKSDGSEVGPITSENSVFGIAANGSLGEKFYDPVRNQLIAAQRVSNRIVILRPGVETTTSVVQTTPNPNDDNQPAVFSATVTSTPRVDEGQMIFTTSSGDRCTDTTLEVIDSTTVRFTCVMTLATPGIMATAAEYVGSERFGYSHSPLGFHTFNSSLLFRNGFE